MLKRLKIISMVVKQFYVPIMVLIPLLVRHLRKVKSDFIKQT